MRHELEVVAEGYVALDKKVDQQHVSLNKKIDQEIGLVAHAVSQLSQQLDTGFGRVQVSVQKLSESPWDIKAHAT